MAECSACAGRDPRRDAALAFPTRGPRLRWRATAITKLPTSTTPEPTAAWQDVYNARMIQGRFFTDFEDEHREDVAVIGYEIDKIFFPAHDGMGKTIIVDGVPYQVIGVLDKRKGQLFKDDTRRSHGQGSLSHLPQTLPRRRRASSSAPKPIPDTRTPPKMRFAACCVAAAMFLSTSPTTSA